MTVRDTKSAEATGQPPELGDVRVPLDQVRTHQLPERVLPLVESYDAVVGDRDRFLWKWAHHLFPEFTLSCVAPEHAEQVQETKLLGLMYVSVLDDIAEKHHDWATFDEAAKLPFAHKAVNDDRDGVDRDVLGFASDVWERFASQLRAGPRAAEFDDVVQYDLKQVVNAMEYSYLANQNIDAITESEVQTYDSHNMMLFGFADIDLTHSPAFDRSELSTLRRVVERAQRMVRIGNWVTTWEREVAEGDFTSGIVAHALEEDIVSADELRTCRADDGDYQVAATIRQIHEHDVEDVFLRQWSRELAAAREFEGACESVDVGSYLDGIETVMEYHLATRGLK